MPITRREIVQKGVEKILDEHKVPYRIHAEVIKKLADAIRLHKQDLEAAKIERAKHEEGMRVHNETMLKHEQQIAVWDTAMNHVLSITPLKGDPGKQGAPGKGIQGPPGESPDAATVARALMTFPEMQALLNTPAVDAPTPFNEDLLFEKFLQRLKKDKSMTISDLKDGQGFLYNGRKYKFEELMHGAGTSSAGGASVLVPTGTVNGVNRSFVFTSAPSVIALDNGNFMNQVSVDGTVNWTGTTTVVLNQAPLFNIFGLG